MRDVAGMIERIKDIVSEEKRGRKVFDRDVAIALGMKPVVLATCKSRNVMPYEPLLRFCAQRKICINTLLFDQGIEELAPHNKEHYGRWRRIREVACGKEGAYA